jgi:hypothetical protein
VHRFAYFDHIPFISYYILYGLFISRSECTVP